MHNVPLSIIRTALEKSLTTSCIDIASEFNISRSVIYKWISTIHRAGYSLHDISQLDDETLTQTLYSPRKKLKHEEHLGSLIEDIDLACLSIAELYRNHYLPSVPADEKPLAQSSFYQNIKKERQKKKDTDSQKPKQVECACIDLSDSLGADGTEINYGQVRVTLANGTSVEFYPGSSSESFVCSLLRQIGVMP